MHACCSECIHTDANASRNKLQSLVDDLNSLKVRVVCDVSSLAMSTLQ